MRCWFRKEENTILHQILFGKYRILSVLGTGSFGTVYLSKHLTLESYRAIKRLPKHSDSPISLLAEAQLLKALHHPGIPIIYDIEEDSDYYYFIEEYVQGVSLEEFLLQQLYISPECFYNFSLQLCDIFTYLHRLTPKPLLYLDLKPEHIIVCESKIKLIDFNVATFLSKEGNIYNLFGNREFSAPELFEGSKATPLCDIYSLGKIMQLMAEHVDTTSLPNIYHITNKAAHSNPACRYETVDKLRFELLALKSNNQQPHLRIKIAVFGCHSGCGTTHFAISLVSALNFMGYSACYYEKNETDSLRQMQNTYSGIQEQNGLLSYGFFRGYPNYGDGILLPYDKWDLCIYDYGSSLPAEPVEADVLILICNDSLWRIWDSLKVAECLQDSYPKLDVICNMGHTKTAQLLAKHLHRKIFQFPYYSDPFRIDRFLVRFVSKLLHLERRKLPFFSFVSRHTPKG